MATNQPSRYAIIDTNSGFVWGDTIASSPIEACRLIDQNISCQERAYTETSDPRSTETGYRVYVVPVDLAIDDGQDGGTIEAVESCEYAGFVRVDQALR